MSAVRAYSTTAAAAGAGVALILWASAAWADPEAIARLFVERVQAGDVAGTKKLFGDPLPTPTAFGQKMSFSTFMNFAAAPESDLRDLPLRLRPGVEPGLVRPPGPRTAVPPAPGAGAGARPVTTSSEGIGLLGLPIPRDPAPVLLPSNEALTPEQLARLLPRLRRSTLEIYLERHGPLASFAINRFEFSEFVVTAPRGEASLKVKW